jgi:tRNA modification GTPase
VTNDDTIVAVASARGRSARGIVRLSGAGAVEIVSRMTEAALGEGTYLRVETRLKIAGTAPFPAAVYVMRAPRSYTREDVVEIHAPGSSALLAGIVAQVSSAGARPAEPGEFTKRAFLNGRIDLAQAEAVCAMVRARSDAEERLALSTLAGDLSSEVRAIRGRLLALAADIEAGLDFVEEEGDFAPRQRQASEIAAAEEAIAALIEKSVTQQVFNEEAVAVIYGPANAGKSTLFNRLAGGDLAIVHEAPGTTRDFLEAEVEIEGSRYTIVDTAGVRKPAEVVERIAVERTRRFVRGAQVVLFVVDGSALLEPEVATLYAEASALPHIVALNKADRGLLVDAAGWKERFGEGLVIEASAATGKGCEEIRRALWDFARGGKADLSTARFWLAGRQRRCLDEALDALARADLALARGEGDEIVSLEVKGAIEALGRVTGEDYVEDLLDEVFSRFCAGK